MENKVKNVLSGIGFYGTLAVCLLVVGVCGWVLLQDREDPLPQQAVPPPVPVSPPAEMPEARLPLAAAVVLVATSPKSNSAYDAINAAIADVPAGRTGPIPRQLQNKHYDGADAKVKGQHYLYPHDYPNHWTAQQYLPDAIKDRQYYVPGDNKNEQAFAQYWKKIKGEL